MTKQTISKTKLAKELGISRSSLYYKPKRPTIDEEVRRHIEAVMIDNPAYGHKRIAIQLKMGHNRIRRVMKKYELKPYRRKAKPPFKKHDHRKPDAGYPNLLQPLLNNNQLNKPDQIWATDFTYIKYDNKFIYLATMVDLFTREVTGVNILRYHNRHLVMGAFMNALDNYSAPEIVHSDQGSEYTSDDFIFLIQTSGARLSMSAKGSPWQNGYQESFFSHFKQESGDVSRFETVGELIEYLYNQIWYYNTKRIHSRLQMSPVQFRSLFQRDKVC